VPSFLSYLAGLIGIPLARTLFSYHIITIGVDIDVTKTLVAIIAVAELATGSTYKNWFHSAV